MFRLLHIGIIVLSAAALIGAIAMLVIERTWTDPPPATPHERFVHGAIGTEILPLPVLRVLPAMFPERWQPGGAQAGDWIEQFGFVRAPDTATTGLPYGFAVSKHRPKSGAPTPVSFVGFSCALCHTAEIATSPDGPKQIVFGMGNHSLDLFAWVDALLGSIADERLTLDSIDAQHNAQFGRPLTLAEKATTWLWLSQAQPGVRDSFAKWETPFTGPALRDSRDMPNGPSRTQAFRELVRLVLDRPATSDHSFSKLPPVFEQRHREWAQVDGSVRMPLARSVFAVLAAGATMENLAVPTIQQNLMSDVEYVSTLKGPRWAEVFSDRPIDRARAERGRAVYREHCFSCHGGPGAEPGSWTNGPETGVVVPHEAIGTDPERVTIRHYDEMTEALYAIFPDGSALKPPRDDIRPGPLGTTKGYINAPLESCFVRVPYLHNGSVLTLAELINLAPRRDVFYRGRAVYDMDGVGLVSPPQPDARYYWTFDTSRRGNSNAGHDYPWTYRGPGWNEEALRDLLEYLKTL